MPMSFPLAATIIFVLLAVEYLAARAWRRTQEHHTVTMRGDFTMMMQAGEELSVSSSSATGPCLVIESLRYSEDAGTTEVEVRAPFLSSLRFEIQSIYEGVAL